MSSKKARIRLGMVGGGNGAFIGEVHRMAARLDDRYELVAGTFSSDPQRGKESAAQLGIDSSRSYDDFATMATKESAREDGIQAVAIVTPNHLHFAPAKAFLEAGIHVICDKPLTSSLDDAIALQASAKESKLLFAVTYNYSGYPMVRQAREMIASGELGEIRVVQVEYPQDWLSTDIESSGQKQAAWRTDPALAGAGGSLGDIGTHAFHLTEFITGLKVKSILADLNAFVLGRKLDDNAQLLLRFGNGARGSLWASQVAVGHENGLRIRVYGEKASLHWFQEQPNQLQFSVLAESPRILSRGGATAGTSANSVTRIPGGHPEGFLEAFANIYTGFADAIEGTESENAALVPDVDAGLRGVRFIEAAVTSANNGGVWRSID
ncbi:MAG: Gfo/Idh/MocA family oxidoreductase [Proteobacteria bacterium]|jgi:predicted dehydrogenase|nr:Gfo/Idh/MocA family oxidoreductase [Pseudomonadota bacterium]